MSVAQDTALPALARLATPAGATRLLRDTWREGQGPLPHPPAEVLAVRVLRYHPGSRCTLRLTLDRWPLRACIVKLYAHGETPAAATLRALSAAGLAAPQSSRVPALLASLPEWRLLVMDAAPGVPLSAWLRSEARDGASAAGSRAARWLAGFHAAHLPLPAAYTLHEPLARGARWRARIERAAPRLATMTASLWGGLVAARPAWPPTPRLIHGDFVAGHVYLAPQVVTVIDWDSCRAGDPAEDAGRFLASLHDLAARNRVDPARIVEAAAGFATTYAEAQPAAGVSISFYTAFACLRKASRVVAHRRGRDHDGRDHDGRDHDGHDLVRAGVLLDAGRHALDSHLRG